MYEKANYKIFLNVRRVKKRLKKKIWITNGKKVT